MYKERLKAARKANGFTAQQMADMLGVTIGTYRHYENGYSAPNVLMFVRIADILNVSLDYLMCRDEFIEKNGGK